MDEWENVENEEKHFATTRHTQTDYTPVDHQETQTDYSSPWFGLNSGSLHSLSGLTNGKPSKDHVDGNDETTEEWEKKHLRYGWGSFTPDWIQIFNSIRWYVFFACIFSLFQGFIVNGVINAIISSLEKRFELPSSKSGLVVSSNDFFAFFLVLLVSFYGGKRHKPRLIGIGVLVLGLGSFIFSLPHFLTDTYRVSHDFDADAFENVCRENSTALDSDHAQATPSNLQNYLYLFMLGNALHGAGSTPMFTLGTTYIDENTKAKMTSFYLGLIYCAASLGVAAGYMLGGQTLNLFTEFNILKEEEIGITPLDPRWVGAWWISFLISGSVMLLIAIPILGFPKRLPGSAKLQAERKSEAYQKTGSKDKKDSVVKNKSWKEFPLMLWALLRNPTFLFLALATCTEGIIVSGIASFGAKFMQEKFNLPAAFAALLMGIITVPGAGGGMLLGGYLVKRLDLKCRGIIRMDIIVGCIAIVCGVVFFIQCPDQKIAGVTSEYNTMQFRSGDTATNLTASCNVECACSAAIYEPVCGLDSSIYFTPCHAGCSLDYTWMEGPIGPYKMYTNCGCVKTTMMMVNQNTSIPDATTSLPDISTEMTSSSENNSTNRTNMGPPSGAYQGICLSDCKLVWAVVPVLFVGMLMTFTTVSPTQTATLRCVHESQKSLAIGFQWLFLRLLGTTPGPLMLGSIIDSACLAWQDLNGKTGSCWIYEKTDLGVKILVWWCLVKGVSVVFYFFAQYFYRAPENDKYSSDEDEKPLHDVELIDGRETVI